VRKFSPPVLIYAGSPMIAVVQRVRHASVSVAGAVIGQIQSGYLVFVGVHRADTAADANWLAERLLGLRICADEQGKMNLSIGQAGGGFLLVSQFTLLGSTGKGNRPGFEDAMKPPTAQELFDGLVAACRNPRHPLAPPPAGVATGQFGADMAVELLNDGPVTVLLDSHRHLPRPDPAAEGLGH
jgi:D-tyrosyl-tRNA(Tyr) deacylase